MGYSFERQKKNDIVNEFQKLISEGRKSNKIQVDQEGEFYNNLFKRFFKINDIEMYSTYNKGKSVVAERFIWKLKNKIFKYMTAISKNVYFDMLDYIVDKYNNTVQRNIEMKPVNVTSASHADSNEKKSQIQRW